MTGKIFISYRRSDSEVVAHRIYDRLRQDFGLDAAFIDIDKMPFVDFRAHITEQVRQARVVLVVIGPGWLRSVQNGAGRADDWVRVEIETALAAGVPLAPVRISGVAMPGSSELPDSIAQLAYVNALPVSPSEDFHPHMDRVAARLAEALGFERRASAVAASASPATSELVVTSPYIGPALPTPKQGEQWEKIALPKGLDVTSYALDKFAWNGDVVAMVREGQITIVNAKQRTFRKTSTRWMPLFAQRRHSLNPEHPYYIRDIIATTSGFLLSTETAISYLDRNGAMERFVGRLGHPDRSNKGNVYYGLIARRLKAPTGEEYILQFLQPVHGDRTLEVRGLHSNDKAKVVENGRLHWAWQPGKHLIWSPSRSYLACALHHHINWFASIQFEHDKHETFNVSYVDCASKEGVYRYGFFWHPSRDVFATTLSRNDSGIHSDQRIAVFSVGSNLPLYEKRISTSGNLMSVAWSSNGRWIATGSSDHVVYIWDLLVDVVRVCFGHRDAVDRIEFSPDGQRLLSIGGGEAIIWDPTTADVIAKWPAVGPRGPSWLTPSWSPTNAVVTFQPQFELRELKF